MEKKASQLQKIDGISFREPEKYKALFKSQSKKTEIQPGDQFQQNLEVELTHSLCHSYQSKKTIPLLVPQDGKEVSINTLYTELGIIGENENKEKRQELEKNGRIITPDLHNTAKLPVHEAVFEPKKPIHLKELFNDDKLKEASEKKVAILGSAGIGKSILCHHIAYMWAKKELFQEFEYVFWLRLRSLNERHYSKDSSLANYLAQECEINKELIQAYLENPDLRKKTLLLLDGYDELSNDAANEDGSLHHVLKELKKFPNFIITSRPSPIVHFKPICKVEILGFDSKGIENYIQKFFLTTEIEKAKTIRQYLNHSIFKSLAHIPINLEIFCSLIAAGKFFSSSSVESLSITSVYWSLTDWLFRRFMQKQPHTHPDNVLEEPDVLHSKDVKHLAQALEGIAWKAMEENTTYLKNTEIAEVYKTIDSKIDIRSIKEIGLLRVENDASVFTHLTFQEYFAAAYLARLYKQNPKKARDYTRRIKFEPRYKPVLSMTAGLLSRTPKDAALLKKFFDDLFSDPYDFARNYQLRLLASCFEECKNPNEVRQYEDFIQEVVSYLDKEIPNQRLKIDLMRENRKMLSHDAIIETFLKNLKNRAKKHKTAQLLFEIVDKGHTLPKTVTLALIGILNNRKANFKIRDFAADALGKIAQTEKAFPEDVLKVLIEVLNDPQADSHAKSSAADALEKIEQTEKALSQNVLKVLIEVLNDPQAGFLAKRSAAKTLGEMTLSEKALSQNVLKVLIEVLNDPQADSEAKSSAAYALGEIALSEKALSQNALKALIGVLNDPQADSEAKSSAAYALGEIALSEKALSQNALKVLIAVLNDHQSGSRAKSSAAQALAKMAQSEKALPEDALKALIGVLNDPQANFLAKSSAAQALAKMALSEKALPEDVLKVLIGVLNDPQDDSRAKIYAAKALEKMTQSVRSFSKNTIEDLIANLERRDSSTACVKNEVIRILESIPEASLPELTESNCTLITKLYFYTGRALFCKNDEFYTSGKQKIIKIKTNKIDAQKIKEKILMHTDF